MKHRIRAAAIIKKEDSILLVKHVHPVNGKVWWVPPGGKVEAKDKSIFDAVKREVWEETGLEVKVNQGIDYIREFLDYENNTLNLEIFVKAEMISGHLSINNIHGNGPDEEYIKDVRWLTKDFIQKIEVFPEIIKDDVFWQNRSDNESIYLGRQK